MTIAHQIVLFEPILTTCFFFYMVVLTFNRFLVRCQTGLHFHHMLTFCLLLPDATEKVNELIKQGPTNQVCALCTKKSVHVQFHY